MKTLCNCVNTIWVTTNVVRLRGGKIVLKSFRNNRNSGVPVSRDFYTMKREAENSGRSKLFGFEGIPVY